MSRPKRLQPANDNRPREILISGLSGDLLVTAAELEIIEVFMTGLADIVAAGEASAAANENDPRPDEDGEDQS